MYTERIKINCFQLYIDVLLSVAIFESYKYFYVLKMNSYLFLILYIVCLYFIILF